MADKKSAQDWAGDWQALQKQYWSAWQDATRNAAGATAPDASAPWQEGMAQWSRMFGDAGQQNETLERMLNGAKSYTALMQSMIGAAAGQPGGAGPKLWTEALRKGFDVPGMDALLQGNPLAKMLRDIGGPGAQGIDQLSASFAPFLQQAKSGGMSWLNAPAFGYAREHQEHLQKTAAAFVEFQEAVKKYNALILKASQRSFDVFQNKLAEREEPGRQIETPRALYDLWVDAAEDAYAEVALSDEFRAVYGEVVNAQMRVRAQVQAEVERINTDLGMPTRTELNSVHKRMHEMRRAMHATDGANANAEIAALRAEVKALRDALHVNASKPVAAKKPKSKPKPAPASKRGAAVTKPRSALRKGAGNFNDALVAMKTKPGSLA